MNAPACLHPATIRVRPFIAKPALREAARIAAKRLAELHRSAPPTPPRRLLMEVADE